jgi:hypothetical protein
MYSKELTPHNWVKISLTHIWNTNNKMFKHYSFTLKYVFFKWDAKHSLLLISYEYNIDSYYRFHVLGVGIDVYACVFACNDFNINARFSNINLRRIHKHSNSKTSTKANSKKRIRRENDQADAVLNASATPWRQTNVLESNVTVHCYKAARCTTYRNG